MGVFFFCVLTGEGEGSVMGFGALEKERGGGGLWEKLWRKNLVWENSLRRSRSILSRNPLSNDLRTSHLPNASPSPSDPSTLTSKYITLLTPLSLTAQCPSETCNGSSAFFYQVQIRSADEPMTTFYKVRLMLSVLKELADTVNPVYKMWAEVEGELTWAQK